MTLLPSSDFMKYSVYSGNLNSLSTDSKLLINTINQYSYCIAEKDADFRNALTSSDVLLPDGIAVVASMRFLKGVKVKKIAGADIHKYFLDYYNSQNGSCFYLGASNATLEKIHARINKEYPNLRFGSYSPPYKSVFSDEDNEKMIQAVNTFKPDVLFIGMTAPKQEKWASLFKDQLDARKICSIGAVFDFYAGTVKRPGKLWIALGLEWLGRLIAEPKRLWRRYLYYGPVFVYYIARSKFKRAYS